MGSERVLGKWEPSEVWHFKKPGQENRRLRKSCFSGSSDEDEGIKHGGGAGDRAREVTWGQLMSCELGGIFM